MTEPKAPNPAPPRDPDDEPESRPETDAETWDRQTALNEAFLNRERHRA